MTRAGAEDPPGSDVEADCGTPSANTRDRLNTREIPWILLVVDGRQ